MAGTETDKNDPLATEIWSTSLPDRVRMGLLSGITSSAVACAQNEIVKHLHENVGVCTCHSYEIRERCMHTERFMYHGVEIRKVVGKLIIGWVCPKLEKLCSEFRLYIWVLGEFDQCPLSSPQTLVTYYLVIVTVIPSN